MTAQSIPAYLKEYIGQKWTNAKITQEFIEIATQSSSGRLLEDPRVEPAVLALSVSEEMLGQAVLNALNQSRLLSLEESAAIESILDQSYQDWIKARMKQFSYKSKRALFRYMNYCSISRREGEITIRPQCHKKLDYWGRERDDDIENIIIPDTASPSEIGAALRLAFRGCITKKGKVIIDNPNIPLEERQQQWVPEARVFATRNGVEIATYSRYGLSVKDTTITPMTFPPNASDKHLGQALQQALTQSRFLSYEEAAELLVQAPQAQKDWISERQAQWGYSTRRGLLARMNCCFVTQSDHQILLKPSHHEKLETWNEASLPETQTVTMPINALPTELGASLRLALSRCTSKVK